MSETDKTAPAADDIEHLLPWFVTGRLTQREQSLIEAAEAAEADLGRRLALVREERDETVRLNEAMGGPSPRSVDELFRRIDAEPRPRGRLGFAGILSALHDIAARQPPRTLVWAAIAAALVVVAEAGIIGGILLRGSGTSYETASGPQDAGGSAGSLALVGFAPDATAAQISATLGRLNMSIVDGPRGGLYRVRLSREKLPRDAADALLAKLRAEPSVVRFAVPAS